MVLSHIKSGIELWEKVQQIWDKINGKLSKKQAELVSVAIRELLSLHPDINKAEAALQAAEITGISPELLRANDMFEHVTGRRPGARKKAAKKGAKKAAKKGTKKKGAKKKKKSAKKM